MGETRKTRTQAIIGLSGILLAADSFAMNCGGPADYSKFKNHYTINGNMLNVKCPSLSNIEPSDDLLQTLCPSSYSEYSWVSTFTQCIINDMLKYDINPNRGRYGTAWEFWNRGLGDLWNGCNKSFLLCTKIKALTEVKPPENVDMTETQRQEIREAVNIFENCVHTRTSSDDIQYCVTQFRLAITNILGE